MGSKENYNCSYWKSHLSKIGYKMNKLFKVTIISATLTSMVGCAGLSNREQGKMIGAVAGAVGAHQLSKGHKDRGWAIGIGALLGTVVGERVGKYLDERDRQLMNRNVQDTLEYARSGERSSWSNPDSGHSGVTEVKRTYSTNMGQYCREFTTTVNVGGRDELGYGTACRQPDGSWSMQ